MKKYLISLITVLPLLAAVLTGCARDEAGDGTGGDYTTLVLKMKVLKNTATDTRTLTSQEEAHIEELDVLVFSVQGRVETFEYHVAPEAGWDASTGTFSVKLRNSQHINDYKRIVLIANQSDRIAELESSFEGLSKADVLELITFDTDEAWDTGNDFTPIPMWGETQNTVIVSSSHSPIDAVPMVRALARIDVGVNFIDLGNNTYQADGLAYSNGVEPFMITGIKVYNSNDKANTAPLATVFSKNVVSATTVPQDASANTTPLEYSFSDSSEGVLSSVKDIYIPEVDNKTAGDDAMFLLVKGFYTAPGAAVQNTTKETWYKVDFYDREENGGIHEKRIDILRNHYYMVSITSVDGPGYDTEGEAATSHGALLGADIAVWDEANMNNVVIGANDRLVVDPKVMELGKAGRDDYKVAVTSTQAWTASVSAVTSEVSGTVSWLTLTTASGAAGASQITFESTTNDDGADRTAYIHVKAGRLTSVVKVTQLTRELVTLEVTPGEMTFYGKSWMIEEQPLNVTWTPASIVLKVEYIDVDNGGVALDTRFDDKFYNGNETFYVQPKPWDTYDRNNDLFRVKKSKFRFTAVHPNGSEIVKEVIVNQFMPDAIVVDVLDIGYSMLGQSETIRVISNVPWEAWIAAGGSSAYPSLSALTVDSGLGTMAGEPIVMTASVGTKDANKGVSEILVASPDGLFEPVSVSITGRFGFIYWSAKYNTYMIAYPYDTAKGHWDLADDKCDDMGNSWYQPSKSELIDLRDGLGGIGANFDGTIMSTKYNFEVDQLYWADTGNMINGDCLYMTKLGSDTKGNSNNFPTRCIKGYHSF